ncbi:MAG: hypothetical protein KJ923_03440 [Candidatus Omnitrophica bacterium]|nr:hypothetical protein [Candidatus Omnitrophota bacterium]
MSLTASMKSLVEDISASTKDRHNFVRGVVQDVSGIKKDAQALLERFRKEHKDLSIEIKEKAKEVKNFLASGEKTRKEDFASVMEDINNRLTEIHKWQKEVRADAQTIRRDAQTLIKEYSDDLKEARNIWRSLNSRSVPRKEEQEQADTTSKSKKNKKREKR